MGESLPPCPPPTSSFTWLHFAASRVSTFKVPEGLPIHGSADRGAHACACPHPALFTETGETDLAWVGLCCSPSLPSCPQGIRSCQGEACDRLERCLRPRRCVSPWCRCLSLAWVVRAAAQPVSTLVQQPGYLCGAVQARPPRTPSSSFLFIETWLLSCPCVSTHIHLLNKRRDSGVLRSLCPGCLSVRGAAVSGAVWGASCPSLEAPSPRQQVKWGGRAVTPPGSP